ncbi:MAG: efflux RND transporter periplasmic adaptor subunit [Prosthecobacter sp.]
MKKSFVFPLLIPALLLLPACSRHEAAHDEKGAAAAGTAADVSTAAKPASAPPVPITTTQVAEVSMPRFLNFTGELKGARQAMLAPDVAGKVVSAPIERGSIVKEGDVILQLDDRAAKLTLQEAEASLQDARLKVEWARTEQERNQVLLKPGAISAQEFERLKLNQSTADTTLKASTARLETAKKALADTVLRAPFGGMIVERLTETGEYVSSSSGVAVLVATETLRLIIQVPETQVGQVRAGQQAGFSVPAFPGEIFAGTVRHVGGALREATRDLAIEAEVANPDGRLRPGMFAEGRLELAEVRALALPAPALRVDADGRTHRVFVVVGKDGASVEERIVEIGEKKDDLVEIRNGVSAGDVVVLSPGAEATDGMRVTLAAAGPRP